MTSIIRSTRLAADRKTLPVAPAVAEIRKPQSGTPAVPAAPAQQSRPVNTAAAPAPITYEEYKQRFSAELNELRKQVIESSREQGLKEGLQQGRQAAEVEYRKQLETLGSIIASAREAREQYVHDLADDVAEIAWAATAKILGDGFAQRSAAVAAVQQTLRRSKERGRLLVRVAPQDLQLLEARRREWLEGVSASGVELVPDEQVRLGGCLLEGACGNLDGRLETQLQRLREALVQARSQWSEPLE